MAHLGPNAELLSGLGSSAIAPALAREDFNTAAHLQLPESLQELLLRKNGFFAFEGALLVRPLMSFDGVWGVIDWNSHDLWRGGYCGAEGSGIFFAEDAFGFQFSVSERGVSLFDPEVATHEQVADSLEEWCRAVREKYRRYTGYSVLHSWQVQHGVIPRGKRLVPATPFFLGGKFELDNLAPVDDLESMRFRSHLYMQTRDLPDGASVRLKVEAAK